jgi:Type II secretion system (T2SS), protein F
LVAVPLTLWLGLLPAAVGAMAAGFAAARRRPGASGGGGAAETVSLLAVALGAGMAPAAAFAEVAAVAPAAAQPLLHSAARRLAGGWRCDEALADTPLASVGATLAAAQRWGAPAVPALRALADDLRADRRAAVEVAAERLQLTLIFPTTLLTLPAFVLGVVPPLLWTTLRG